MAFMTITSFSKMAPKQVLKQFLRILKNKKIYKPPAKQFSLAGGFSLSTLSAILGTDSFRTSFYI